MINETSIDATGGESQADKPARKRGECSGCGSTDKTLTAPRPNVGHAYRGEMFCLFCNPRFTGGEFLDTGGLV